MTQLSEHYNDHSVCVLGLGYVGLTLATVMAEAGFNVLGVEVRDDVVSQIARGEPHFFEPGLPERLAHVVARKMLTVANHIPEEWQGTVFIITVGTPLAPDGKARLDMIETATRQVSQRLNAGDMVIVRSTVKSGITRGVVARILEEKGLGFDIAFCPERTLEGKALVELRQLPQIVGGATLAATIRASQMFQFLTPTVVRVSDMETAEMIKLIDNAQRDVWFAYANEVARACDALGISAAEVINAGKLGYPRTNLPMPGPVGGPCLEKDPHILSQGIRELGVELEITPAARRINERQPSEIADYLAGTLSRVEGFPKTPTVCLLGLAFKGQPATDDLRGSMAKPIFAALKERFPGARFKAYDPMVSASNVAAFGAEPCESLRDAFDSSHLAVILNNHPELSGMPLETLAETMARPALVYDFWNNFVARDLHLPTGVGYAALGSHGKAVLPTMVGSRG